MAEGSESSSERRYKCERCHDQQYIGVYEGREYPMDSIELVGVIYTAKPCQCLIQENLMRLFGKSNIPDAEQRKGFSDFNKDDVPRSVKTAFSVVYEYFMNFDAIRHQDVNSLVLLGDSGFGKTHLLTALANNLIAKKSVGVIYFRWIEGMQRLKSAIKEGSLDEKINAMYEVDVLFIDDLFKTRGNTGDSTGFEFQRILDVVDKRNTNRRPFLITSELYDEQLANIDIALWGRIRERSQIVRLGLEDDEKAAGIVGNYRMR